MTLEEYAGTLRCIKDSASPFRDGDYVSHTTGRVGYWAEYKLGSDWLWYSVSDTSGKIVLPSAVLKAIADGDCQRAGAFKGTGFEATVRFGDQSYMLGVGSRRPRFGR
jgi:hypothetical protein